MSSYNYNSYTERFAHNILIRIPYSICRDKNFSGFDALVYSSISVSLNFGILDTRLISASSLYFEAFCYDDIIYDCGVSTEMIDKIEKSLNKLISLGHLHAATYDASSAFDCTTTTYVVNRNKFTDPNEKIAYAQFSVFTYFLDHIGDEESENLYKLYLYIMSMRGVHVSEYNKWIAVIGRSMIDSIFGQENTLTYMDKLSVDLSFIYYEMVFKGSDWRLVCGVYQDREAIHYHKGVIESEVMHREEMLNDYWTLSTLGNKECPFSHERLVEMKNFFIDYNDELHTYQQRNPNIDFIKNLKDLSVIDFYLTQFN